MSWKATKGQEAVEDGNSKQQQQQQQQQAKRVSVEIKHGSK